MPITSGALNTTQTSVTNSISTEGMFAVVVILIAVLLFAIIISSDAFARIANIIRTVLSTIRYALYGFGTCGLLAAIYGLVMLFRASAGVIDPILYVYAVLGYIGLTVLGIVSEKVYLLLKKRYDEYKATNISGVT